MSWKTNTSVYDVVDVLKSHRDGCDGSVEERKNFVLVVVVSYYNEMDVVVLRSHHHHHVDFVSSLSQRHHLALKILWQHPRCDDEEHHSRNVTHVVVVFDDRQEVVVVVVDWIPCVPREDHSSVLNVSSFVLGCEDECCPYLLLCRNRVRFWGETTTKTPPPSSR